MKLELTAIGAAIGFLAGMLAISHLTLEAVEGWANGHRAILVLAVCVAILVIACIRFAAISTRPYRRAR